MQAEKLNNIFKMADIQIKAFGESEIYGTDFANNGIMNVNDKDFRAECQKRGYNCTFIDVLEAKYQEKNGWHYKLTK